MFEVYLTVDGPRLIEDETDIRLMHALAAGKYTVAKISDGLRIDQDEVSSHLASLVEAGLVWNIGANEAGQGPEVYSKAAHTLIESTEAERIRKGTNRPFVREPSVRDNLERWMLTTMIESSRASGVSIGPFLNESHYDLGLSAAILNRDDMHPFELKPIFDMFSNADIADFEILSRNPLRIWVSLRFSPTLGTANSYVAWFSNAITGYLQYFTDEYYTVKRIQHLKGSDKEFIISMGMTNELMVGGLHSLEFSHNMRCDFSLYWNGEKFFPVCGLFKNHIMEKLCQKVCSVSDISAKLGTDNRYVSEYVRYLYSEGMVKIMRKGKDPLYLSTAVNIFRWKRQGEYLGKETSDVLHMAIAEPEHAVRYWFQYFLLNAHKAGFDNEQFLKVLGKLAGDRIMEHCRGLSNDEVFDRIEHVSERAFAASIQVVGRDPVEIILTTEYDLTDFISDQYCILLDSLFSSMLSSIGKIPFQVLDSAIRGSGNRVYHATFIQSFMVHR